jgi:uncharacterized repeat protein (TIGR03803 family)
MLAVQADIAESLIAVMAMEPKGRPGAWAQGQFKALYRFTDGNGGYPSASLIFDSAGNLYGTTTAGGTYGDGVVFELASTSDGGWTQKMIHQFTGKDGSFPAAGLIFDQAGNLYGTTEKGGAYGQGVIFELTPNSDGRWTEKVLHVFCSLTNCSDGRLPVAGLVLDAAGNLYGTTTAGGVSDHGDSDQGVVFKLAPDSNGGWNETVLHVFGFGVNNGRFPAAGLIFDQAGNLYGTTQRSDQGPFGVVFKMTPNSNGTWSESVIYTFTGFPGDGSSPLAGLTFDQAGNLYGTTSGYFGTTFGSVFEITP